MDIKIRAVNGCNHSFRITSDMNAVSLLKSRELHHWKAMNNNCEKEKKRAKGQCGEAKKQVWGGRERGVHGDWELTFAQFQAHTHTPWVSIFWGHPACEQTAAWNWIWHWKKKGDWNWFWCWKKKTQGWGVGLTEFGTEKKWGWNWIWLLKKKKGGGGGAEIESQITAKYSYIVINNTHNKQLKFKKKAVSQNITKST